MYVWLCVMWGAGSCTRSHRGGRGTRGCGRCGVQANTGAVTGEGGWYTWWWLFGWGSGDYRCSHRGGCGVCSGCPYRSQGPGSVLGSRRPRNTDGMTPRIRANISRV